MCVGVSLFIKFRNLSLVMSVRTAVSLSFHTSEYRWALHLLRACLSVKICSVIATGSFLVKFKYELLFHYAFFQKAEDYEK